MLHRVGSQSFAFNQPQHVAMRSHNPMYCLNSSSVREQPPFCIIASEVAYMQQSNSQNIGKSLKKIDEKDFLLETQSPSKLASFLVWMTSSLRSFPSNPHVWPGRRFLMKGITLSAGIFRELVCNHCQLSTVNCQLSTVNCQLSTVNCQL